MCAISKIPIFRFECATPITLAPENLSIRHLVTCVMTRQIVDPSSTELLKSFECPLDMIHSLFFVPRQTKRLYFPYAFSRMYGCKNESKLKCFAAVVFMPTITTIAELQMVIALDTAYLSTWSSTSYAMGSKTWPRVMPCILLMSRQSMNRTNRVVLGTFDGDLVHFFQAGTQRYPWHAVIRCAVFNSQGHTAVHNSVTMGITGNAFVSQRDDLHEIPTWMYRRIGFLSTSRLPSWNRLFIKLESICNTNKVCILLQSN